MSELGSWAGLYHWATEKLMLERMAAEKDVLQVLANRANPLGFCWPGTGYIAKMIGRMDATVENALRRLELMDFIRISQTQNLIRNRIDIDFQVSPFVLFIAPEKLPLAMELWEQNRNINITNEIKESQPTPGTRIKEPTPVSNPRTTTTTKQLSVNGKSPDESPTPDAPNPENAKSKTGGKDTSGNAAKPTAAAPQSPIPPTPRSANPPPPLVCYDAALADESAEMVAARMNAGTRYMMAMAVARGLVVKYGAPKCEAALSHMALQTNVRTPAGYLRTKIERGEIDPVQDAKIPVEEADVDMFKDGKEYISGKYADYIKYKPDESDIEIEQESHDE